MSDLLTRQAAGQLFRAVRENNLAAVTSLVTAQHSLVRCTDQGWTPLLYAAYYGFDAICMTLLAQGAAVTDVVPDTLCTPLHIACEHGHTAVVEILIRHQSSLTAKTRLGYTPLHSASSMDHLGCVVALCRAGADKTAVDNAGEAAIHLAAGWGHQAVVVLLLDQGCEVDMVSGHTVM